MSYPIGMQMPYGYNNFNDLQGMLGLWGGQNQQNADVLSQYLQYMPQQTTLPKTQSQQNIPQNNTPQQEFVPQTQTIVPAAAQQSVAQENTTLPKQPEMDPDDGKISWSRKLKNVGKGMLNMVNGLFCDEKGFSIKRTLTTATVAGAAVALTVATGGAAAPFLVGAGVALGSAQAGKGVYKAIKAKTDAEAEAAWQDIGAGTLSIGLSAAGAKGALKAAGKPVPVGNAVSSSAKATWESIKTVKNGAKTVVTSPKETLVPLAKAETWATAGGRLKTAWNETMPLKSSKKSAKEVLGKAYDKDVAKLNKKANKLANEISELQAKPQTDALKLEIQQKTARLSKLYKDINRVKAEKANIGNGPAETGLRPSNQQNGYVNTQNASAEARKAAVEQIENNIKDIKANMKEAPASRKAVYEKQLKAAQRKLNETKKLNKIDERLDIIKYAESKNAKLKTALDKLNRKIADVENGSLPEAQKSIELAKLNRHKANVEKLITINKSKAAIAKAGLYKTNTVNAYKNMPGYEKALTVGITGGLNKNSVAENSAISNYQMELAQYNQELLNAQQEAQEELSQQADQPLESEQTQTAVQHQTPTQVIPPPQYQTPTRNIYQDYYNAMQAINTGTPLGFDDLYVSPYPEMLF